MPFKDDVERHIYNRNRQRELRGYKGTNVVPKALSSTGDTRGIRGDRGEKGIEGGLSQDVVPQIQSQVRRDTNVVPMLSPSRKWDAETWWSWHRHLVVYNEELQTEVTRLDKVERELAKEQARTTLLEADLARLDAMISSMMAEEVTR